MSAAERANRERGQRYGAPDRRGWDLMHGICGCGKKKYASRADAKRAARQRQGGHAPVHGGHARVYRCGEWWHITSQDAETVARFREQP